MLAPFALVLGLAALFVVGSYIPWYSSKNVKPEVAPSSAVEVTTNKVLNEVKDSKDVKEKIKEVKTEEKEKIKEIKAEEKVKIAVSPVVAEVEQKNKNLDNLRKEKSKLEEKGKSDVKEKIKEVKNNEAEEEETLNEFVKNLDNFVGR